MKILITDDHALFREGLRYVLMQLEHNVQILEAGDCDGAIRIALANRDLDLILLDLSMDGNEGIASFNLLRGRVPSVPIVIVSAVEDRDIVQQALDRGAHGYIPKSTTGKRMIQALQKVLSGGICLPDDTLSRERDSRQSAHKSLTDAIDRNRASSMGLTLRQIEVLSLLCKGFSNKDICRTLGVSVGTVKRHVTDIFRKLQVSNRTQAVMTAQKFGLKV